MIKKLADLIGLRYINNQGDIDIVLNDIVKTWEPTRDPHHCAMVRDWLFEKLGGVKIITTHLKYDGIEVKLQVPGLNDATFISSTYEEAFCGTVIELFSKYKKPRSKKELFSMYPDAYIKTVETPQGVTVHIFKDDGTHVWADDSTYEEAFISALEAVE